jgi:hypothetical protein
VDISFENRSEPAKVISSRTVSRSINKRKTKLREGLRFYGEN